MRIGVVTAIFALLMGFFVAPAAAGPGENRQDVIAHARVIAQHSDDGFLTPADRRWLSAHPEFAAITIDPELTEVGEDVGEESPATGQEVAGEGMVSIAATNYCRTTNRYQNNYTVLGALAFRYHTHVRWCYDGTRVTSVPERYGYFSSVDIFQYPREVLVNTTNYFSAYHRQAHTQQRIENCVLKYGCISSRAPWNKVNVYGNGTNSYSWGS